MGAGKIGRIIGGHPGKSGCDSREWQIATLFNTDHSGVFPKRNSRYESFSIDRFFLNTPYIAQYFSTHTHLKHRTTNSWSKFRTVLPSEYQWLHCIRKRGF